MSEIVTVDNIREMLAGLDGSVPLLPAASVRNNQGMPVLITAVRFGLNRQVVEGEWTYTLGPDLTALEDGTVTFVTDAEAAFSAGQRTHELAEARKVRDAQPVAVNEAVLALTGLRAEYEAMVSGGDTEGVRDTYAIVQDIMEQVKVLEENA